MIKHSFFILFFFQFILLGKFSVLESGLLQPMYPGLCKRKHSQQHEGGDYPSLFSHEAPFGVWHPALASSAQQRPTGASPE